MATLNNRTGYLYFYKNIPDIFKQNVSSGSLVDPYSQQLNNSKKLFSQDLWIEKLTQDNGIEGQSYQSRFTRHFYPRYYSPGNLSVSCITNSQEKYQEMAMFIRSHHKFMANLPTSTYANAFDNGMSPFLMTLSIPNEGILMQGIVDSFNLNKKGVFDPAPKFNLNFIILYDSSTSKNASLGVQTKTWYESNIGDSLNIQKAEKNG